MTRYFKVLQQPLWVIIFTLLGSLLSPPASIAQGTVLQFRGYAKNLAIHSSTIAIDTLGVSFPSEAYFLNLTRFRLQGVLDLGSLVHSEIWLDTELLAGDFLSTPDYQLQQLLARPFFFDLDWTITEGHNYVVQQQLFRAFATVYLGAAELTLGRQRIAWGAGFAWNPTDLLNPFNPTAIELEERAGVDAAYASAPFGALSRIEAVYAPGRGDLEPSAALRASSNLHGYDFSVMAGDFRRDKVVGGDFAGYVGGAGFRGEFAYTWTPDDDDYFRAVLNADYNFPNDLYAILEFYYNGQGAANKEDYNFEDLLSGTTFNLARLYLAASLAKSVTPLLQVSLYDLLNLSDGSTLIGPALVYSLATNLEITASAYFFLGDDDSEYGLFSNTYFAYLQFYF